MAKMIYRIIESCSQCPYQDHDIHENVFECWDVKEEKHLGVIKDGSITQPWCPLPDAPEADNET